MANETIVGYCKECGIAVTEENLYSTTPVVTCKSCHDAQVQAENDAIEQEKRRKQYDKDTMRRKRNLSIYFGSAVASIILIFFVVNAFIDPLFGSIGANIGGGFVLSYVGFSFTAAMFFDGVVRNFLEWMFTRTINFPGLIFSLDLDGILWFITVKLIFGILGFLAGVLFAILGVVLALCLAPIVYPFSLIHQNRCIRTGNTADFD